MSFERLVGGVHKSIQMKEKHFTLLDFNFIFYVLMIPYTVPYDVDIWWIPQFINNIIDSKVGIMFRIAWLVTSCVKVILILILTPHCFRALFIAVFKHLMFVGARACYRTALEFCKLLLSLDPEGDPLGVLLAVDFYALRAQKYEWLIKLASEWEPSRNLSQVSKTTVN